MKKVLFLFLLSMKGFAQEEPKDVIYKGFYNISFYVQSPLGQFKKAISSDFSKVNSSGISFSYLINPRKKAGELSSILWEENLEFLVTNKIHFSCHQHKVIFL